MRIANIQVKVDSKSAKIAARKKEIQKLKEEITHHLSVVDQLNAEVTLDMKLVEKRKAKEARLTPRLEVERVGVGKHTLFLSLCRCSRKRRI